MPVTWTYDYTNLLGNVSTVSHTEYITQKSLELGDSTLFTFGTGPDLSGYGSYDLSIYVSQPGDTVNSNDTIGPYKIVHEEPFSSFPYVLDFDDANTVPGNNTPLTLVHFQTQFLLLSLPGIVEITHLWLGLSLPQL